MSWFRQGTQSQGSSQRVSTVQVQGVGESWFRWVKSCSVVRRVALVLLLGLCVLLLLLSRRAIRPRRTMLSSIVSMLLTTVSGREEDREGKNQRRLCV
jgi:hypothetical protein